MFVATLLGSFLCPIIISCFLYAAMICIKKRIFLNKINPTKETLEENIERHNSKNDENEDPSQESTMNPEVRGTNKKSQANSNGTTQANFTKNQPNEVIHIFWDFFLPQLSQEQTYYH
jgi:hypothetical protein